METGLTEASLRAAHSSSWARRWRLAPRHARVAVRLLQGMSDKETAAACRLSFATVRTYVKAIYRAAGVHSRIELLRAALRVGRRRAGRRGR